MITKKQNDYLCQLGGHIQVARKLRNITQDELRMRANLSRQVVINAEKGMPIKTDSLLAILSVLDMAQPLLDSIALQNDPVGLSLAKEKLPKSIRGRR